MPVSHKRRQQLEAVVKKKKNRTRVEGHLGRGGWKLPQGARRKELRFGGPTATLGPVWTQFEPISGL